MIISWNMQDDFILNQGSFFVRWSLRTFYQPSDRSFSMSSSSKSFAILTMNLMKQDLKRKVVNVNDRNWWKFSSLIEEDIVCLCHHVSPNGFAIFTNQQIESTHVCVDWFEQDIARGPRLLQPMWRRECVFWFLHHFFLVLYFFVTVYFHFNGVRVSSLSKSKSIWIFQNSFCLIWTVIWEWFRKAFL